MELLKTKLQERLISWENVHVCIKQKEPYFTFKFRYRNVRLGRKTPKILITVTRLQCSFLFFPAIFHFYFLAHRESIIGKLFKYIFKLCQRSAIRTKLQKMKLVLFIFWFLSTPNKCNVTELT